LPAGGGWVASVTPHQVVSGLGAVLGAATLVGVRASKPIWPGQILSLIPVWIKQAPMFARVAARPSRAPTRHEVGIPVRYKLQPCVQVPF